MNYRKGYLPQVFILILGVLILGNLLPVAEGSILFEDHFDEPDGSYPSSWKWEIVQEAPRVYNHELTNPRPAAWEFFFITIKDFYYDDFIINTKLKFTKLDPYNCADATLAFRCNGKTFNYAQFGGYILNISARLGGYGALWLARAYEGGGDLTPKNCTTCN